MSYYDKTFDLNDLQTVDFVKSQWAGPGIAHTMLTFGFRGRDYLTVSAEARRERGEPQTALRGLFKQYEIIYVLGDERDLIRLRTNFRGEEVYLYATRFTPEQSRIVLLDILEKVNRLAEKPEFYDTLTQNCTLTLVPHLEKIRPRRGFDIRLLLNGYTDEIGYENGAIATNNLPFAELQDLCHINKYVKDHPEADGYSKRIRPHIQGR